MYNILLLIVLLDSFVYSSLDEITEIDILYDGPDSPLLIRNQTQHNQFTLIPYQECKIKCIKEDNSLIWVSDDENNKEVQCIFLTIDNDDNSRLVSIVLDGVDSCESLYFEKQADNTWVMINEDIYNEILDNILRAKKIDLSRKNVDIYTVSHFTRFGNSKTSFTSALPEKIVEVSDEEQILWLGELDGLCCTSAILHSRRGVMKYLCLILDDDAEDPSKLLYCNDEDQWQPIDGYTYAIGIDRLENEIFLDLSNDVEYSNTLHVAEYNQNGIKSLLLTVPINNYLTEVKDGDSIIWEASNGSTCTWSIVNFYNDRPKLLQIFEEDLIQTKITFYHKNEDSSWVPISLENYHNLLDRLDNELE